MQYVFGNFTIDPGRFELSARGHHLAVEPQVFDVLRHLVENRDRVVSTEELIDKVWSGRIVSDSAIASRVRDVRRALEDDGATQRWIRTIRGRGFRFVGEVEVTPDVEPASAIAEPIVAGLPERSEQIASEVLCRPAIAVLPFTDLSDNSGASYLADGLTDEVIGALCAWRWFPVIARNTSYRFRNSGLSAAEIGRSCGARYLLQGAIRCELARIRVSIELIDAERDLVIWHTGIKRATGDLLILEEEIAADVVTMLEPEIRGAEMRRVLRKASGDPGAWDLAMRAKWHAHRGDFETAEQFASQAQHASLAGTCRLH